MTANERASLESLKARLEVLADKLGRTRNPPSFTQEAIACAKAVETLLADDQAKGGSSGS